MRLDQIIESFYELGKVDSSLSVNELEVFSGDKVIISNPILDNSLDMDKLVRNKPSGVEIVSRFKLTYLSPKLYKYEPYDLTREINIFPLTNFKSEGVLDVNFDNLGLSDIKVVGDWLLVRPLKMYTCGLHNGDLTLSGLVSVLLGGDRPELKKNKKEYNKVFKNNINRFFKGWNNNK